MNSSPVKRVVILTSVHPAFDVRIFHKECKTLVSAGYQVTLIAKHDKPETIDGIRIIPLQKPKNRLVRMLWLPWVILFLAGRQKADVYHFHDPELIPVGLLLRLFTKGKVIYDVHEDVSKQILSKQYIPKKLRRIFAFVYNLFEKKSSNAFNYIICATDIISNKFKTYNKNSFTVRNYISKSYTEYFTGKNYHSQNEFNIVFAGAIYEERAILEAIKALNLLKDLNVFFVLCGPADQDYYKQLISEDKSGRIIYKGVLSYENALQETFNADIGYICDYPLERHMEGLPVKLFEYMAIGIPVVASDFPAWNNIVLGAKCGLTVNPLDPQEIARAMRYLFENEDVRKEMGENGRRAIIAKYNWESEARTLLAVYRSMEVNHL